MEKREYYQVSINRFNIELACSKLIEDITGESPMDSNKSALYYTHFYNIKFEGFEFDCDEGDLEYRFTFSDNGALKEHAGGLNESF